ncbi:MAG: flavoprotein [Micromonosporaceae bacterium]
MNEQSSRRVLYVVVCAAGPAHEVSRLLTAARADGWDPYVITTPEGLRFADTEAIERSTGHPVRHAYRSPREQRSRLPHASAVIVAPATFNTINKLATGISDNYALGVLAECVGAGVPIVVLPFINSALAARLPLRKSVESLRAEGIQILLGDDGHQPHPPGEGSERIPHFPWQAALFAVDRLIEYGPQESRPQR